MKYESSNYLIHHGVKGQQWGKRHGPPYPLNKNPSVQAQKKKIYGRNVSAEEIEKRNRNDENTQRIDNSYKKLKTAVRIIHAMTNPIAAMYLIRDGVKAARGAAAERSARVRKMKEQVEARTGFHLKKDLSKKYTIKEDAKAVNPGFINLSNDTKNNCMLCTSTYELRRRGYDVTAKKASVGYSPNYIKDWFPGAEIELLNFSPSYSRARRGKNTEHARLVYDKLAKQPNNSRGNLMLGFSLGSGHSVAYEINNGVVTLIDAQSGKVYPGKKAEKILKSTFYAEYARLDNLNFSIKCIKECCE